VSKYYPPKFEIASMIDGTISATISNNFDVLVEHMNKDLIHLLNIDVKEPVCPIRFMYHAAVINRSHIQIEAVFVGWPTRLSSLITNKLVYTSRYARATRTCLLFHIQYKNKDFSACNIICMQKQTSSHNALNTYYMNT